MIIHIHRMYGLEKPEISCKHCQKSETLKFHTLFAKHAAIRAKIQSSLSTHHRFFTAFYTAIRLCCR